MPRRPIAFFSSGSGNTARLAARLGLAAARIPARQSAAPLVMASPFVLIVPSYGDAEGRGAVPKAVIRFLNEARNREHLRGVIASGNRNFGDRFAEGGRIVARKCGVPVLYRFELSGTETDIRAIDGGVARFLSLPALAA